MRYIIGLLFMAIGVLLIFFSNWFMRNFGRIAWAEAKLGSEGGTRLFYKLVGFGLFIVGMMFITGRLFSILEWIFIR